MTFCGSARSPLSVLLAALVAIAALAVPPAAGQPPDGSWAQLGVPLRLGSALLWDSARRRLVGLGPDAFGRADSVEDAWEFREATGWRRIRLPQPPAGEALGLSGFVPDPAHGRFLQLRYTDTAYDSLQLWALELSPGPHWKRLDVASKVPMGSLLQSVDDDALWSTELFAYPEPAGLWARSTADTGVWRRVGDLPQEAWNAWVDARRDRFVRVSCGSDSVSVATLP